jgi:hypothetical protein
MRNHVLETQGPDAWIRDPKLIERARIVLVISLSKKTSGELVRILMDWLDDRDIYRFCQKYLDKWDLAYIEGRPRKP